MIITEEQTPRERVILLGVSVSEADDTEQSLRELKELAQTAGAETVGMMIQNREQIHPGTYIGSGKIEEVRQMAYALEADAVICDDELSPAQLRNLQQELDMKVMDRTLVILDIFAARASTSEGKIQVELAQLKYRQARLVGLRDSLSRLGGGIGTRGPGEKKLEMDRRLIKNRIAQLNRELEEVKRHREITRSRRSRKSMPVAAIVGYTNAGKSTLLNRMTGAQVLEEDKLFATLDPTTRVLELPSGQEMLLTDTVGFIRKLPHHLIDAFRSTLEEAKYADIILHVVDASNPQAEQQMLVVYETLHNLGVDGKTVVTLFNKQDRMQQGALPDGGGELLRGERGALRAERGTLSGGGKPLRADGEPLNDGGKLLRADREPLRDRKADHCLPVSAKYGDGLEELRELLEKLVNERNVLIERLYAYSDAGLIQLIRRQGRLLAEEYRDDGIYVRAYVPMELYARVTPE